MTEDEAKTKWCPMARVPHHGEMNVNRSAPHYLGDDKWSGDAPIRGAYCIASGCMMWRWTNEVTGRGFCGLAGSVGLK